MFAKTKSLSLKTDKVSPKRFSAFSLTVPNSEVADGQISPTNKAFIDNSLEIKEICYFLSHFRIRINKSQWNILTVFMCNRRNYKNFDFPKIP